MWSEKVVPATPLLVSTSPTPTPSPDCAGPLTPGTEILGNNKDLLFPGAFSSFAISVDTSAMGYTSSASSSRRSSISSTSSSGSHGLRRPSALKHNRSSSSGDYTPRSAHHPPPAYGRQVLSTIPASPLVGHPDATMQSNPFPNKVRWGQDSEYLYTPYLQQQKGFDSPRLHRGRRRSTAAIIEYVTKYIHAHTGHGAAALMTPKRISILFLVVFSAVYLALNLLPGMTFLSSEIRHDSLHDGRRHQGYYGNSRIFRGGDGLRDPHSAGDEHDGYEHGSHRRYIMYEDDVPEDYVDRFERAAHEQQRQRSGSRPSRVAVATTEDDNDEYAISKASKLKSGSLDAEAILAEFRASLHKPADEVIIDKQNRKGRSPIKFDKSRIKKPQEASLAADLDIPDESTQIAQHVMEVDDGLDADVDAAASASSRLLLLNKQAQRRIMINPARRRNTGSPKRYMDDNLVAAGSPATNPEVANDTAAPLKEQEIWKKVQAHPHNKRSRDSEASDLTILPPQSQRDLKHPLGHNFQEERESEVAEQEHLGSDLAHASMLAEI